MPAKGSHLKHGNRNYVFSKDFYKERLVEKKGITLPFKTCKAIIEHCNKTVAQIVIDELDGFKMPFGLGYIVAGKYKPTYPLIDWKNTKKTKKYVYHLNLHTFGFAVKVYWFRVGRVTNTKFHELYTFASYKTLSSAVSAEFGSGRKPYAEWDITDFIEKGRVQNLLNKRYNKALKEA